MSQDSLYIKSKSKSEISKAVDDSRIRLNNSGSNDVENQPGSSNSIGPYRNPTGVPQPGQFDPSYNNTDGLTTKVAGMGKGGVNMPPEVARDPLNYQNAPAPYNYSGGWFDMWGKRSDLSEVEGSSILSTGSVENMPSQVIKTGVVSIELERTTSLDKDRIKREKKRHRRRVMKDTLT